MQDIFYVSEGRILKKKQSRRWKNGLVIVPNITNNFIGNSCKSVINSGAMAARITVASERTRALINGDSVEKATGNVVSKSMESAVNESIAGSVAKAITATVSDNKG